MNQTINQTYHILILSNEINVEDEILSSLILLDECPYVSCNNHNHNKICWDFYTIQTDKLYPNFSLKEKWHFYLSINYPNVLYPDFYPK